MSYLENVERLDKNSILDEELFHELMEMESEFERESAYNTFRDRAKDLGVTSKFDNLYSAMKREYARMRNLEKIKDAQVVGEGLTDFDFLQNQFRCNEWVANEHGVGKMTPMGMRYACYNPVCPTKILRNVETGKYKTELTFKIRNHIRSVYIDREDLASASKIIKLANDSLEIAGNGAPLLVEYLSLIEHLGSIDGYLKEYTSTSRLGWIEDSNKAKHFLPYESDEIIFDGASTVRALFDSISQHGSREKWYSLVKEIRAKKQPEVLINLAASFASVLVDICNDNSFIVSLWGGSGIGKTVILKLCTSVWADPGEGKYITDAKATTTAMEMRLNTLNSLPMTLDDMAQIKNHYDEDFSELIYRWCAGKGRDRSNKELGLNKLTSWRCCIITNGERSLVDEGTQGGAVNRVIDVEASGEKLFTGKTGNKTVNIVENNYGFAGKEFIQEIKKCDPDEITSIKNGYFDEIMRISEVQGCRKEDKQASPMALILTADELSERFLFKDGVRLVTEDVLKYLKNTEDASEGYRAYEALIGIIDINRAHFADNANERPETNPFWGWWFDETCTYIAIFPFAFKQIMKEQGFQAKAFLSWAKKMDLLQVTEDKKTNRFQKKVKHDGKSKWVVVIRTDYDKYAEDGENSGFLDVDVSDLPF